MRSSVIVFNQLFIKRKYLESLIESDLERNILRGMSLGEIIVYNDNKIKDIINTNKIQFNIIKNRSGHTIFKDTVNKGNLSEFYNIIKLLLSGEEENYQLAGFLCSLAKEKKYNDFSLTEVILNFLSYISQCKIKKFMILIKDGLNDDSDYKKQILMHSYMSDKVKQLALEKVSEMKSNNNDYHKQLLFVKTLLKFPWISQEETNFFKHKITEKEPSVLFSNASKPTAVL